ncbi:MAG: hypothetical protein KJN76_10750 [Eudoraea sp.]|nr:hypothetical protein [Eudoraea sp.]
MKLKIIIFTVTALLLIQEGYAQQKNSAQVKDTVKQMNLLDKQVEVLAPIFGMMELDGFDKWNDISNYLEVVELSNLSPEMKQHLREQYKLYDLSLDPQKKDSLKLVFNKQLKEAMVKSAKKDN